MYRKTESILPPLREKVDNYSYTNKETIGKGFSSNVYRGKNDITDEQVAIKVIDMKTMKGDVHRNLLASQIEILSLIKNKPNLLDVHKIYSDKNKTYIITNYCEGGDLGKVIKSKKKLPQTEAIRIIQQIIKGYESLYELGVVHRDLKPANIFFHNSGPEIGDFGFAIKQESLKITQKYNVGSPVYMPPEALISNKYSHKSDIWAIGVIFFEMLTGNTPWTGRTETELKTKIKTVPIKNILPANISKASTVFLIKALDTDHRKRMDVFQMFAHFEGGYIKYDEKAEPLNGEKSNKLFRSMRKQHRRISEFDKTRGESMKKTSNLGGIRNPKSEFLQTQIPKTALESKTIEKQYLSAIKKRMISKQLLSQVHFCRFVYKLTHGLQAMPSFEMSSQVRTSLISLLFSKLSEIKELKLLNQDHAQQYTNFGDYKKLKKLVEQYHEKYKRKLNITDEQIALRQYMSHDYQSMLIVLTTQILSLFQFIQKRQPSEVMKQIITLDYLITLRQLMEIMKGGDLEQFHMRSKIQAIVEGDVIDEVSGEHVRMISHKLKALRII